MIQANNIPRLSSPSVGLYRPPCKTPPHSSCSLASPPGIHPLVGVGTEELLITVIHPLAVLTLKMIYCSVTRTGTTMAVFPASSRLTTTT
jgi:hypothetical protein